MDGHISNNSFSSWNRGRFAKHLNANKEILIGKPILNKFGADPPYLPKVSNSSFYYEDDCTKAHKIFSQSRKLYHFKSTQIKTWQQSSTRKTQRNLETPTTNRKSQLLWANSRSSSDGSPCPKSSNSSQQFQFSSPTLPMDLKHISMERR